MTDNLSRCLADSSNYIKGLSDCDKFMDEGCKIFKRKKKTLHIYTKFRNYPLAKKRHHPI